MPKQKLTLEQKVSILKNFIDDTESPGALVNLLDNILLEFEYRNSAQKKYALKEILSDLRLFAIKDSSLMSQYFGVLNRDSERGFNYMAQIAQEVRLITNSSSGTIDESSQEWEKAVDIVNKRMAVAEKSVDYKAAYGILAEVVELRIKVYENLSKATEKIGLAANSLRKPYRGSWTSGSQSFEELSENAMQRVLDYLNRFPARLAELRRQFKDLPYLELRYAKPQARRG